MQLHLCVQQHIVNGKNCTIFHPHFGPLKVEFWVKINMFDLYNYLLTKFYQNQ